MTRISMPINTLKKYFEFSEEFALKCAQEIHYNVNADEFSETFEILLETLKEEGEIGTDGISMIRLETDINTGDETVIIEYCDDICIENIALVRRHMDKFISIFGLIYRGIEYVKKLIEVSPIGNWKPSMFISLMESGKIIFQLSKDAYNDYLEDYTQWLIGLADKISQTEFEDEADE